MQGRCDLSDLGPLTQSGHTERELLKGNGDGDDWGAGKQAKTRYERYSRAKITGEKRSRRAKGDGDAFLVDQRRCKQVNKVMIEALSSRELKWTLGVSEEVALEDSWLASGSSC